MKYYLDEHKKNRYFAEHSTYPGLQKYKNKQGWDDYYIGNHIIFSHRITPYDEENFPDKLHAHIFYEMDIYNSGQISYVSDEREIIPQRDDVLLFPPGCSHTARLLEPSRYDRYVFYFSPQLFDSLGDGCTPHFFQGEKARCHYIAPEARGRFFFLLEELKTALESNQDDMGLQAYSYALQLFLLISRHSSVNNDSIAVVPQKVLNIKDYIDTHFQTLGTITEVAAHFYYSREYISRLFKQYYNLNLSEYLVNKKIEYAKLCLEQGKSVGFAFDACGFHTMSSFVNAFKVHTGMTPSEYKRSHTAKNAGS